MGKWYDTGFDDGVKGFQADPPWQRHHRDHKAYYEGYTDGRQAEQRLADDELTPNPERPR